MKITGAKTRALSAPEENPLIVGKDPGGIREYVSLELSTDEGIKGLGISFFGWKLTPALKTAVDIMAESGDRRRPHAARGGDWQDTGVGQRLRPRRHLHSGVVCHRHSPLGHQGQSSQPARV